MEKMFYDAEVFDRDINTWDVSKVQNMNSMFTADAFNQNLPCWNTDFVLSCTNFADGTACGGFGLRRGLRMGLLAGAVGHVHGFGRECSPQGSGEGVLHRSEHPPTAKKRRPRCTARSPIGMSRTASIHGSGFSRDSRPENARAQKSNPVRLARSRWSRTCPSYSVVMVAPANIPTSGC